MNFFLERFYLKTHFNRVQIYLVPNFQIIRTKVKINKNYSILATFDNFFAKNSLKRALMTDFEAIQIIENASGTENTNDYYHRNWADIFGIGPTFY